LISSARPHPGHIAFTGSMSSPLRLTFNLFSI
jgi:hypothetical protein